MEQDSVQAAQISVNESSSLSSQTVCGDVGNTAQTFHLMYKRGAKLSHINAALHLKGGALLWSHVHNQLEDVRPGRMPSSVHIHFDVLDIVQVNVSCDQGISRACFWTCQYWCEWMNDGTPAAPCFHNLQAHTGMLMVTARAFSVLTHSHGFVGVLSSPRFVCVHHAYISKAYATACPMAVKSALHSSAQPGTAQHRIEKHSIAQHSTAQHSTAQHSTARCYTTC